MTPPKTPRPPTTIPRDRDVRVTKSLTPLPGSFLLTAPIAEHPSRDQDWDRDAFTPVNASDFEIVSYRSARAAELAKVAVLELEKVRTENNEGMSEIHGRVDVLAGNVGEMHVGLARLSGAVETLVPLVHQSIGGSIQTRTITMTAQVDVDKAQQLDVIDEKKWRRDVVIKVLAAVGSGGAITLLIAGAVGKC